MDNRMYKSILLSISCQNYSRSTVCTSRALLTQFQQKLRILCVNFLNRLLTFHLFNISYILSWYTVSVVRIYIKKKIGKVFQYFIVIQFYNANQSNPATYLYLSQARTWIYPLADLNGHDSNPHSWDTAAYITFS